MLAVAVSIWCSNWQRSFWWYRNEYSKPSFNNYEPSCFFAYPTWMSGDKVWVTGAVERDKLIASGENLDAISGETILGSLAQGKEVLSQGNELMNSVLGVYSRISW